MSYIVSARKYRPATFRSVIGQGHITRTLQSAIAKGQLAHAYLFTGPRGVGKTTCARIFAKSINCLEPTAEHEACGKCESCKAFDEGRSWGIHELDAASNNSVEDIRALIEKVRIAPQVGKYSVYIIDEVHMLSQAAFNAFLKTLEEPPAYAIFILATTEKHKILPTILSRCQSYDFRRIGVKDIVEYLQYVADSEGVKYDDESLNIIAQKADGGMRDALSTFDRVVSYTGAQLSFEKTAESVGALDFNTYFNAVQMAVAEDFASLLMLYDSTLRAGFDGQIFIGGMADHLRNLLVAKNPTTLPLLDVAGSLKDRYGSQAATIDVGWLMNAIALITGADAGYRTATNRRLHVELALMKLCGLKKKDSDLVIADVFTLPAITLAASTTPTTAPATTLVATATAPTPTDVTTSSPPISAAPITPAAAPTSPAVAPVAPVEVSQPKPDITPQVTPPQPVQQVVVQPVTPVISTPQPTPVQARGRISITGISINGAAPSAVQEVDNEADKSENAPEITPERLTATLTDGWAKVVAYWNEMGRPRIATAMTVNKIENGMTTILVPNDTLREELLQHKIDIEASIFHLLGVRAPIDVEITEQKIVYRPVSVEQKLQHLIERNPKVSKLLTVFDLSI